MSNNNAMIIIDRAKKDGAMVFVNNDNFEVTTPLFRNEVTQLKINPGDCHKISGKYMPKKETVDRIGEAAGISFTNNCSVKTEIQDDPGIGEHTVYVAFAQAQIRQSDGSYRISSIADYEFDPVIRAMSDNGVTELTPETKQLRKVDKYGKQGKSTAELIIEYKKVARQRANTGARLRVIKELVGMPNAFDEQQLAKPLIFGRVIQNTDYILKTPEGRAMATAQALGIDMSTLFGGRKIGAALPAQSENVGRDIIQDETAPTDEQPPNENPHGGTIPDSDNKKGPEQQSSNKDLEILTVQRCVAYSK